MSVLWRQQGLTLVELMVATTLSLILLAGVLVVFSANKATYSLQNGLGTLQENGRYAIQQIAADIQLAGYGGCLSPRITNSAIAFRNLVTPNPPATDFLDGITSQQFFQGRDDETGGFAYDTADTQMYAGPDHDGDGNPDGTDSLQIRGPLDMRMDYTNAVVITTGAFDVVGMSGGFEAGDYLAIADCLGADLFVASGVSGNSISHASGSSANTQALLSRRFNQDATVTRLNSHTYFVADTGRNNAGGQDITALYREDEDPSTPAVEIVDGVEDLQIEYGLDTDGDGDIDTFRPSRPSGGTAMSAANWADIIAIRVSLLVNSVENASGTLAPYTFAPAGPNPINPPANDLRLRQEFSALISVRNGIVE